MKVEMTGGWLAALETLEEELGLWNVEVVKKNL